MTTTSRPTGHRTHGSFTGRPVGLTYELSAAVRRQAEEFLRTRGWPERDSMFRVQAIAFILRAEGGAFDTAVLPALHPQHAAPRMRAFKTLAEGLGTAPPLVAAEAPEGPPQPGASRVARSIYRLLDVPALEGAYLEPGARFVRAADIEELRPSSGGRLSQKENPRTRAQAGALMTKFTCRAVETARGGPVAVFVPEGAKYNPKSGALPPGAVRTLLDGAYRVFVRMRALRGAP